MKLLGSFGKVGHSSQQLLNTISFDFYICKLRLSTVYTGGRRAAINTKPAFHSWNCGKYSYLLFKILLKELEREYLRYNDFQTFMEGGKGRSVQVKIIKISVLCLVFFRFVL